METVALPLKPAPQLASGEAHVWYFQPETLPMPGLEDPVGAGSSLPLPARRMQQKFLLRLLLGAYLGCPGHAVRLGRSASGKPVLESPAAEAAPGFSLSHSRRWTAIVIGPEPLGLDIEEVDRPLRAVELARRWFSTAEFESLERAPERERNDRFLRFWTTREAMIKALGDTVGRAMREIELDASARPVRVPRRWPGPNTWHLQHMRRFEQLRVCLATPSGAVRIREFRLQPPAGN